MSIQNVPYENSNSIVPTSNPVFDFGGTVFNVKSFGALGNGSGDDSVAINMAIQAAGAVGGGTVIFPFGTYQIMSPVSVTVSNITIEGQGVGTTIRSANNTNMQAGISITGSGVVECKVRKIHIDMNYTNNTSGDGIYIKTPWVSTDSFHVLEDIYIENCPNNGVEIGVNGDTREMKFLRVHVKRCNGNAFYMAYPSQTDATFDTCIADTIGLSGFYVGGANNHYINCKAFYCGSLGGLTFGFYVVAYNNYFINCEAQDNYQSGLYSQNDGDPTYGTQRCMLIGFIADSNNQAGNASYGCGVQLINCSNWEIIGGEFFTRPYPSFTQRIGISLQGTTTGTLLVGVKGTGNSSALYSDTSSGINRVSAMEGAASTVTTATPVTALTDAATIATDASLGNLFSVTIAASRTMGAPTNPTGGQTITYRIIQGGAGSFTITWNAAFAFNTTYPQPTLSTAVGKTDYISFIYNGTAAKWQCVNVALGN